MKCPHCLENFHDSWSSSDLGIDDNGRNIINYTKCPSCKKYTIELREVSRIMVAGFPKEKKVERRIKPVSTARPLPTEVKDPYSQDFIEACNVLPISPKASAALSRFNLQNLLREKANVKRSNLSSEIDEVIKSGVLPTHIEEDIDAVRKIGNFAAHPIKSTNTGEITSVEPGEAEWLLDVLEELFDFYFVKPELSKRKRTALNLKLKEAGVSEMKMPTSK